MIFQSHGLLTTCKYYSSTTNASMTIKIGWQVACHDGTENDAPPFGNVVLQDQVTNQNHYISTISTSMATKLERIVTYIYFFLPLKIT